MISSFHERIREPDATYISPRLMSEQLETSLSGLSRLMDLHRNTLRPLHDKDGKELRPGHLWELMKLRKEGAFKCCDLGVVCPRLLENSALRR